MRWDIRRKLNRNRNLVEYRDLHPDLAWQEIADMFNVSRQRARDIYEMTKLTDSQRTM